MTKVKAVRLEVTTDDGVQTIEWSTGEALAKLLADSVDLKTVVNLCVSELESHKHLRQVAVAREAAAK